MPHRRRALAGLITAALAGALLAAPVSAAKPAPAAKAPAFGVTVNVPSVGAYPAPKVYLAFTFTVTSMPKKATTGFARFVAPSPPIAGRTGKFGWTPALQRTDPLARGYFRVEAKTCASATVAGFTPSNDGSEQSIDIGFACQPGQTFVLHWFPTSQWYGFNANNNDIWHFPVSARTTVKDAWAPQTAPQLQVDAVDFTQIINIPFIHPPVKLIEVTPVITDPNDPNAPRSFTLTGNGYIDVTPVQSITTVTTAYRADTGSQLVINDPELLRQAQTTIHVVGCLELDGTYLVDGVPAEITPDCDDLGLVVKVVNPVPGVFTNLDGTAMSQTSVLVKVDAVSTTAVDWDKAGTECRYDGGQFIPGSAGPIPTLWICDFTDLSDLTRYNDAKAILRTPAYCPTGSIKEDPVTIANRDVVCNG